MIKNSRQVFVAESGVDFGVRFVACRSGLQRLRLKSLRRSGFVVGEASAAKAASRGGVALRLRRGRASDFLLTGFCSGAARMTVAGRANLVLGDDNDGGGGAAAAAGVVEKAIAMAAALAVVDDSDEADEPPSTAVAGGATPWPNCRAQTARSPPSTVVV